ncbi:MAG TPA: serine/threonine-protein kinase [Candidatus Sulfotelmatobacter sp.]|nr:serine/threonine-protein kinase [Candidatus Sulfotelmatobacter sp.]
METYPACPVCGTTIVPGAPQGLCPECLLRAGFETKSGNKSTDGKLAAVLAPLEEVARSFPALEIIELAGHGGMGAVYKVRQRQSGRFAALKFLFPEKQSSPQFAGRFEGEARMLAALSHPNIVTVYDFGKADGRFYLLMEYVDGLTLRQLFRARRLSPAEAVGIVPKVCDALQYAHDQGVIHRDIKPENILLDKSGQVKIADFGIAKMLHLPGNVSLTGTMDVVGTPLYMAPEQIENPQLVDSRADIYSLGVVFYEMLTGELPLGKFQPPSQKLETDPRLDEVVIHALEKEPDRRYQQVGQMKVDVETIAQTMPEEAGPKADVPSPGRPARSGGLVAEAQAAARAALQPKAVRRTPKMGRNYWPKIAIAACVILILAIVLFAILLLTMYK